MSFRLSVEDQELLAETFRSTRARLTAQERLADWIVDSSFVVAAALLWLLQPPQAFAIEPAVVSVVIMVVATLVRFDTPMGFTVATQLGFVLVLFAVPPALAPVMVVCALAIARLPAIRTGRLRPSRLVRVIGNSWFAIGPVAVFVLTDTPPDRAGIPLLLAALAAQFAVDFAVSAIRLSISRGATLSEQLEDGWVYAIDASLSCVALIFAKEIHTSPLAPLALLPMLGLLGMFAHERHARLEGLVDLNSAYRGTARLLSEFLEADDSYTGEHCRGVVALSLAMADLLGLSQDQRRNIEFGALLHDVGKIAIPNGIINKPGKLDPDEWTVIRTHTLKGQEMLDQVGGFMKEVGLIVRSHHERWDGTGYPDGLSGDAIPLEARIIAGCDTWNAMLTNRSYREAMSYEAARSELRAITGSQLDPEIVGALAQIIGPDPAHAPEVTSGASASAAGDLL